MSKITLRDICRSLPKAGVHSPKDTIAKIRNLLGNDVVLLHVPKGEKGPRIREWQKTSVEKMSDSTYLKTLEQGNVGVLLGKPSNGLCTIDIDSDEQLRIFLDLNPKLKSTLLTRRGRGGNLWLRLTGSYPALTPIKDSDGHKWGEWRSTGGQTIVHGEARDSNAPNTLRPYVRLHDAPPIMIRFDEIVWPMQWQNDATRSNGSSFKSAYSESKDDILHQQILGAKQALPLPSLIKLLGYENGEGKSCCPFHNDSNPSFSVFRSKDEEWGFKCHSCDCKGDEISFIEKAKNLSRGDAISHYFMLIPTMAISPLEKPCIEFNTPSELKNYIAPKDLLLVGDAHITRGSVFLIGGAPGIGKSRSAVALAQAGATGKSWFGLKVHRHFKTMIVQNENGKYRLQKEFENLDCEAMDEWVRVCPPPAYGLAFDNRVFQEAFRRAVLEFKPDVLIIDPWNAAAKDEKARDYLETFKAIRAILPAGDTAPAIGIVAHTRKPRADEKTTGRGLLNLIAGSYVLGSVPRAVFVMQAATDDPQDDTIVWTCCKNNDGEMGARSAWKRRNGLFEEASTFDWEAFDNPTPSRRAITETDMAAIFEGTTLPLSKSDVVQQLRERTGMKRAACYNAINPSGRFSAHLREDSEGLLAWAS